MSNDNKTLADAQPGGMVRLGDGLLPCPFCGDTAERIDFGIGSGDNEGGSCVACTGCGSSGPVEFGFKENFLSNWNRRALSAQPSPGGQGDSRSEKAATFLRQYLTYLRSSPRQGLRPRWCDVYEALEVAIEALAARQPVGEPAFFANRWEMEHGTADGLVAMRAGKHMKNMKNKDFFTVPLYTAPPAQAVDLGELREMLVGWKNSDYPLSYEGQCAQRALDACVADLQGWLDSQAVGNG